MEKPVIAAYDFTEGLLVITVNVTNRPALVRLFRGDFDDEIGDAQVAMPIGDPLYFSTTDFSFGTFIARVTDCYANNVDSEPFVVPLPPAPAPTDFQLEGNGDGTFEFSWNWDGNESAISGFHVESCDASGNLNGDFSYEAPPEAREIPDITNRSPGYYYFVVYAIGRADDQYQAGANSFSAVAEAEFNEA